MTLREAVLIHDLGSAINRIHLHGWEAELQLLTDEQLRLYAEATGQTDKLQGSTNAVPEARP